MSYDGCVNTAWTIQTCLIVTESVQCKSTNKKIQLYPRNIHVQVLIAFNDLSAILLTSAKEQLVDLTIVDLTIVDLTIALNYYKVGILI